MIDVSKIADIVLLMIDGNFGFEMETMEFLNALSASGMPGNVFGILTHLDLFRKPSTLKDAKKRLKHRFWSELYQGAKLFYLSGVINGRYPDREVHNLSRFISVMKNPRPLIWRNSHPYCLADRFLDVTPPTIVEENPKCDRTIALYGYLRGTNFPADGARVHIPGVGDLSVSAIEALPDPCPTPFMDQAMAKASGKSGRRRLGEKQKVLFAPMSDVGGVLVDKDAVYIDVKTSNFDKDAAEGEERGLGEQMVVGLQGERRLLGEVEDGVRLFAAGESLKHGTEAGGDDDIGRKERRKVRAMETGPGDEQSEPEDEGFVDGAEEDEEEESGSLQEGDIPVERLGRTFRPAQDDLENGRLDHDIAFAESDSEIGSISSNEDPELESGPEDSDIDEDSEDEDGTLRWKSNLTDKARNLHSTQRQYRVADFARLLYDETLTAAEVVRKWRGEDTTAELPDGSASNDDVEEDENFFRKAKNKAEDNEDLEDRLIPKYDYDALAQKWSDSRNLEQLRHRFATANLTQERNDNEDNNNDSSEREDDEGDGEFEDLEAELNVDSGVIAEAPEISIEEERAKNARRKE